MNIHVKVHIVINYLNPKYTHKLKDMTFQLNNLNIEFFIFVSQIFVFFKIDYEMRKNVVQKKILQKNR